MQYITVSTRWISAGPTSKMLVQPQPCIGPTLYQHSTNFWDLPDRCHFDNGGGRGGGAF